MRKILLASTALLLAAAPADAQLTRNQLQQQNNQNFVSNGQGRITGPIVNSMNGNMISSMGILSDTNAWVGANLWGGASTFNGVATFNGLVTFTGPVTGITFPVNASSPKAAPFNAVCDNLADDTAALQAWATATVAGAILIVPAPGCVFKSTLNFPSVANVTFEGGGTLTYSGANTTVDGIVIGDLTASNGCATTGWYLNNLRLMSTTVMTAGDALHIEQACQLHGDNWIVGGGLGGNRNWRNAVHLDGGNNVHVDMWAFSGKGSALTINGAHGFNFTDPTLLHGTLVNSLIGLHIAGGVGGLHIDATDDLLNGDQVIIDQANYAVPNLQLEFGPAFVSDLTDTTTYPAGGGIGIHMEDPGGTQTSITFRGHLQSAENQCFVFDAGSAPPATPIVNFTGAIVGNCHTPSALHGGAIDNQNIYSQINVVGTRFFTSQLGGTRPTVFNVSGARAISLSSIDPDANFNISGLWGGFYKSNAGEFIVTDTQTNSPRSMTLNGSGNSDGAGIKMIGNGVTTPGKTIRVNSGIFQVLSDDYGTALLQVTDGGSVQASGPLRTVAVYTAAGTPIPTCGTTTKGSFATVGDATSSTGAYTSGGGVTTWEWCNGSTWTH